MISVKFPNRYYCYYWEALEKFCRDLLSRRRAQFFSGRLMQVESAALPVISGFFALDRIINKASNVDVTPSGKLNN